MNTENDIDQRYDDVIFENRNKTYGAYSIRREYDSNLSKGSFASFLFMACLFGVAYAVMLLGHRLEIPTKIPPIVIPTSPPIIIKYQQVQKASSPQTKTNSDLPPRVVDKPVDMPIVETPTTPSTGTIDGPPVDVVPTGIAISGPPVPAIVEPPKTLDFAEVMPEFEGGQKALYKFLRKMLRYPAVSERTGEEGIVFVRFIIDATGVVTGVEVVKGVSAALDKEASRVISLMPHWKPGKQHGTAVNVRMVLPIKFEIDADK